MAIADDVRHDPTLSPRIAVPAKPRFETPVVPRNSIAGSALIAVVAIMTFLASLTTGAAILVGQAAGEWQADVAREVTIQVVPAPDRDTDALVDKAAAIARAFPGIADVRVFTKEESGKLLEPWLGSGLKLDELPIPRLIVVRLAAGASADMAQLKQLLTAQAPGATLDDHRGWIERMRAMAGSVVGGGIAVLILIVAATVLSVTFATRGAMATNKNVIEVLHLVGAKNGFIAEQFSAPLPGDRAAGRRDRRRRGDPDLPDRGADRALDRGQRRRRSERGAVRLVFPGVLRLRRRAGADRAQRGRHRADLAAHGQPHARSH